jgi:hypothetical protein
MGRLERYAVPVPEESGPRRTERVLAKGDRVELIVAIPGQPALRAGACGVVLLAADELETNGLCTVRITGTPRHTAWQLHPRDLRWIGTGRTRKPLT